MTFEYRLNVLEASGNGGYADKSRKKNVAPIPLRVTNNSSDPVTLHRDLLDVTSDGARPYLVPPQKAADDLGQAYGWHVLWGLLNVYYTSSSGKTTYIPVGPVISVFNIIRGATANAKLESDFEEESLYGVTVPSGATVSGLVFVADGEGQPLEFIYRGSDATARAR
ncbi:hypothetical protein CRI94_13170 [Longibacter salinarum]|uniref:Uncharacterized protein n=1 Tax=Longibacter salinarum TaxID=1850348 RepID=A0A2A8CWH4_9BACT|nr:hypothetical protein CRI94_13170 [Longibacter salinarum]